MNICMNVHIYFCCNHDDMVLTAANKLTDQCSIRIHIYLKFRALMFRVSRLFTTLW